MFQNKRDDVRFGSSLSFLWRFVDLTILAVGLDETRPAPQPPKSCISAVWVVRLRRLTRAPRPGEACASIHLQFRPDMNMLETSKPGWFEGNEVITKVGKSGEGMAIKKKRLSPDSQSSLLTLNLIP